MGANVIPHFPTFSSLLLPQVPMAKLTKRYVDAAQPRLSEWFIWDAELKGFGVRVRPSGRKFYLAQYRFKGRTRRLMLGEHGRLTADQARVNVFEALNAVAHDQDPAEARDFDRRAVTLGQFIEDVYLPDAEKALVTYRGRPKKAGTLVVDRGRIKRHILPLLGWRKLQDLTAQDCVSSSPTWRQERQRSTILLANMSGAAELPANTPTNRLAPQGILGEWQLPSGRSTRGQEALISKRRALQ